MYTPILLALPFLAPALGHTIPRHANRGHHAHAHAARFDTPVERSYPKAHFGIPPSSSDLSGVAGFKREDGIDVEERTYPKAHFGLPPNDSDIAGSAGFKRDGKKLVRRRKRSCAVKPSASATSSFVATVSDAATSSIGGSLHSDPSSSSSVVVAVPTTTVAEWDDSTHGVPAATTASAVSSSAYEPSSTFSSAAAASSSSNSDEGSSGLGGLMGFVFPRGKGTADWSTVTGEAGSLSFENALKPLAAGKLPAIGTAPDGSAALIASYPANTVKLASGQGYSFYSAGAHDNVIVDGAKEVMFSYSIFFQDDFHFARGGKLPGLYGGTNLDTAKSCSGGRQDGRDECFSARLMWRTNGDGEIYNYLPSAAYSNDNYCNYPPYSLCDAKFGESIGRGAFRFPTGEWTTVAIRLKLNDVGVANGEQELFVNGKSVISLTDLTISVNSETKIYGIMAQTFFGGSDQSWASPIDQSAYFKDWSLAVLA